MRTTRVDRPKFHFRDLGTSPRSFARHITSLTPFDHDRRLKNERAKRTRAIIANYPFSSDGKARAVNHGKRECVCNVVASVREIIIREQAEPSLS